MAGVAGKTLSPPPRRIGPVNSTVLMFLRSPNILAGTRFPATISGNSHRHNHHVMSAFSDRQLLRSLVSSEGPSCLLVGPIETANQETLEALYRQARDAYYSGTPLIVDDMFDRVELKLRWYGSKYVVKYPRCSLLRQSTYADAQEDPSQKLALASIWCLILLFGSSVCLLPMLYTFSVSYQQSYTSDTFYNGQSFMKESLGMLNSVLLVLMGSVIGLPIASASARALQGLWRHDLVALKGACPNCGEEVFAFVSSYKSNSSPHRADCHVCESLLEFRTKAEKSILKLERGWVHGRVYLISKRQNRR